ncbi:MAG TPA: D-2-hydroxyacid dehydrogenase [Tepidisphaeraceae bacterium]|jgi:phosphoglycerate dehydrogenase-like enzyme|nr:D-2-hydroxyacid dehydrogenase [Tepidisphaeraceae bacterium]
METRIHTVWTNAKLTSAALQRLRSGLGEHRLIVSKNLTGNLAGGSTESELAEADAAFGQPHVEQILALPGLKWVQLNSAGYTRYDRPDVRSAFAARGGVMTNSSGVYAEPCAEHCLAMMLGLARRLPDALTLQRGDRSWPSDAYRIGCRLLLGQKVLLLGYGAIGRRLAELLRPFDVQITALRRHAQPDPLVRVITESELAGPLAEADHIVNVLPANDQSVGFLNADRIATMKPTALFYNIGRGNTVDQKSLLAALQSHKVAGAYLDVTDPEPAPPTDPIWSAPNCYITPHAAGGHDTEFDRQVDHFLDNLRRFEAGEKLVDRIF